MTDNSNPRQSTVGRTLLLLFALVAFLRVVWRLDAQDLWWDESLSLQRAESALLPLLRGDLIIYDGLSSLHTIDQHPFAYFLLLGGFIRLAGDSEFALRFVSVMAVTLLPAVLWVLARWFVRRDIFPRSTPYFAAGFAAISPFFLWFGQEVRPYALWGMLAPLSTYLLLRTIEDRHIRWGWAAGFLIAELLFLTSHFYAAFLLPVHVLLFFLWLKQRHRILAWIVSGLLLATAALAALIAYWFFFVIQGGGENFASVGLDDLIPDLLNAFSLGLSVDIERVWWIDLLFAAVMLVGAGWSMRSPKVIANYGWLPAAMIVVPVTMLWLVNQMLPAYMTARHMSLLGGSVLLMLGGGLGVIFYRQRWIAAAIALVLVATVGYSNVNYFTLEEYAKNDMDGLGGYLADRVAPGDALLIKSPYSWRIADYYLPTGVVDDANAAGIDIIHYGVPLIDRPWPETAGLLNQLREDRRRVWLVRIGPHLYPDVDEAVEEWFEKNMYLVRQDDFFSHSTLRAYLFLPEVPVYEIESEVELDGVVFGDQIRLVEYKVGDFGSPDLALPVTITWQPLVEIDRNYKYRLQLIEAPDSEDPPGDAPIVIADTEREPYDGTVATSYWNPGVTIVEYSDMADVPMPPDANAHRLSLRIYDRETLEPLPATVPESLAGQVQILTDGSTVILPLWPNSDEQ